MILLAPLAPLEDESLFNTLLAAVPQWRRDCVNRMKVPSAKCQSLGASALFGYAMRRAGLAGEPVRVNPYGKPSVEGIEFSLSHTEGWAMCATSDLPIGCDVEHYANVNLDLAKRFFSPDEIANDARTFYRLWTLKESYIKLLGMGLSCPLNSFSISLNTLTVRTQIDTRPCFFFEQTLADGAQCAVCSLRPITESPIFIRLEELVP